MSKSNKDKHNSGQYYTKNSKYITQNLLEIFPKGSTIIDPFAGEFDLLNLVSDQFNIEAYDIDPKNPQTIKQDTLLNPPDYKGKWVITNPPFVARNKNENKIIYDTYEVNDYYKASLISIMGCEGGVVVLPLNFFSGRDSNLRRGFLSDYKIKTLNIFLEKVFDDTNCVVAAFSFYKCSNTLQDVNTFFYPSGKNQLITLKAKEGYRIGAEVFKLPESRVKIWRLREGQIPNSNIFLKAIDSGREKGKIKLEWNEEPFFGYEKDRSFATICFDKDFTKEEQLFIIDKFNLKLNRFRSKYDSLFLTQYRNTTKEMARKRIHFNLAYRIISNVIQENNLE
jgi:hypothetical protein